MITVTVFARKGHPACDQVLADLESLQAVTPHTLAVVDIDSHPDMTRMYEKYIPVVEVGPYHLQTDITRQQLQVALSAAQDRVNQMERSGDEAYAKRLERGHKLTRSDRFTIWFTRHYMAFFNVLVLLYVGLPFLAPVLQRVGANFPARVIYSLYSPLCHQLGFRSFFLFGEQPYYPRELAGLNDLVTFEQATGLDPVDLQAARHFTGDSLLGYKVALCERDIAIYGSILLFGLAFAASGRRMKSLPWYVWLIVGVLPIALDGVSQLPSLMNLNLGGLVPIRESTPMLRVITGMLFGFTTAWFGYPFVEDTVSEARRMMAQKLAVINRSQ